MAKSTVRNREKTLAVITVAVIIGALLFTMVVEPYLDERDTLLRHLDELELRSIRIDKDLSAQDYVERQYSELASVLAKSEGTGDNQQAQSVFVGQLKQLYQGQNLYARSVRLLPTSNEKFHRILSIKIDFQGNIEQILGFIHALERSNSPIKIVKLDIEARDVPNSVRAAFVITKVVIESHT